MRKSPSRTQVELLPGSLRGRSPRTSSGVCCVLRVHNVRGSVYVCVLAPSNVILEEVKNYRNPVYTRLRARPTHPSYGARLGSKTHACGGATFELRLFPPRERGEPSPAVGIAKSPLDRLRTNGGIAGPRRFLSSRCVLLSRVDREGVAVLELWERVGGGFASRSFRSC